MWAKGILCVCVWGREEVRRSGKTSQGQWHLTRDQIKGKEGAWGVSGGRAVQGSEQQGQSPLTSSETKRCVSVLEERRGRRVFREVTEVESCRPLQAMRALWIVLTWKERIELWGERGKSGGGSLNRRFRWETTKVAEIQVMRKVWNLEAFWKYTQRNFLKNWIWRGRERGESRNLPEHLSRPALELTPPSCPTSTPRQAFPSICSPTSSIFESCTQLSLLSSFFSTHPTSYHLLHPSGWSLKPQLPSPPQRRYGGFPGWHPCNSHIDGTAKII